MVLHTITTHGAGAGGHQSEFRSLTRHGSVYTLTGEEVQSHLNEPLHSMNLDELVRNVVQAGEAGHFFLVDGGGGERENAAAAGERQERRTTLGETTLENFLAAAGEGTTQNVHWWRQQQAQEGGLGSYAGRPVPNPSGAASDGQGANASPSPAGGTRQTSDPQTMGQRKRWTPEGMAEKTVERRQKRMIKNRESAARSRARKQAYTNELENKISLLEEENERLRNDNKELETVIHCAPRPEPKNQLRRTTSAAF